MFNFKEFYSGLLIRTEQLYQSGNVSVEYINESREYWEKFPKGELPQFKNEIISLLKDNISLKNLNGIECALSIGFHDGFDKDYTDILLALLDEDWHRSHENVVSALEDIKEPKTIGKLYETAINIPEDDEMRALAKKCMWALLAIQTPESIDKIQTLSKFDDEIIQENALFHLENIAKKSL